MNIYLIPYTGWRHLVLALVVGGAALLAWWGVLFMVLVVGPWSYEHLGLIWAQRMEGPLYLTSVAVTVAVTGLLAESSLRRRKIRWRIIYAGIGGGIALVGTFLSVLIIQALLPVVTSGSTELLVADDSLVSLRFRILQWLVAGFWSGAAPFLARNFQLLLSRFGYSRDGDLAPPSRSWLELGLSAFSHVGGGVVAAAFAAAAWHLPGHDNRIAGDLYLASAFGPFVWGFLHGLLVWPIPEDLYAGWVRVLSAERHGLRIPIPHTNGAAAERFIGHFPRGLDMYLPHDRGVEELHASFIVNEHQVYAVRGLSVQPTMVKRMLERIDLRYDPRRPAPLETQLKMEDRIVLGEKGETVVEFLMLPREER